MDRERFVQVSLFVCLFSFCTQNLKKRTDQCKYVEIRKHLNGLGFLVELQSDPSLTSYFPGCAEQGQLGRVAECFAHRGGRKGLGKITEVILHQIQFLCF